MTELQIYYNNTQSPWGKLLYKSIFAQLSFAKSLKVLDFGSGFGITANHLAENNEVIAIEPNKQMIDMRFNERLYTQMSGGIELLDSFQNKNFDLIICHNVLEYIENKEEYIAAFSKLLKAEGRLSLVKHNHFGRILHKIAHDNDLESALDLVNGNPAIVQNFGEVKYYDFTNINHWNSLFGLKTVDIFGIRTFFALYPDNTKFTDDWIQLMFELESKVWQEEEFCSIAFYNHVLLESV